MFDKLFNTLPTGNKMGNMHLMVAEMDSLFDAMAVVYESDAAYNEAIDAIIEILENAKFRE